MVWALLLLGVLARSIRYLLQFPLWPDETYLAVNYLDRSFLELTRPLDHIQIAPVLYLWVQQAVLKLLGFSELTLRLYVFACGIGSLFLFRHLAGRLLGGIAYLLAFGTFAVAYPLLRYSADAKPYGSDMFVSLVLLSLTVEWCRQPGNRRWWWALTLALPPALLLSYPAMFVAGGIALTMAAVLWRRGALGDWLRWVVTCAAIAAGFAACTSSPFEIRWPSRTRQQTAFAEAFPPLDSAWKFARFLVESNTSESMAYPVGLDHGGSVLTTLLCLAGVVSLLRARRFSLVLLCAAPLALSFLAALLHRYPYGNHSRFALFMAPIFCLLTGLGAAAFLARLKDRRRGTGAPGHRGTGAPGHPVPWVTLGHPGSPWVTLGHPGSPWVTLGHSGSAAGPVKAVLAVFVFIAVVAVVRDFLKPYKEPCWERNRDFARWFWTDKATGAELACYVQDMHGSKVTTGTLATIYYCNQRIYSTRLAKQEPLRLEPRLEGPSAPRGPLPSFARNGSGRRRVAPGRRRVRRLAGEVAGRLSGSSAARTSP